MRKFCNFTQGTLKVKNSYLFFILLSINSLIIFPAKSSDDSGGLFETNYSNSPFQGYSTQNAVRRKSSEQDVENDEEVITFDLAMTLLSTKQEESSEEVLKNSEELAKRIISSPKKYNLQTIINTFLSIIYSEDACECRLRGTNSDDLDEYNPNTPQAHMYELYNNLDNIGEVEYAQAQLEKLSQYLQGVNKLSVLKSQLFQIIMPRLSELKNDLSENSLIVEEDNLSRSEIEKKDACTQVDLLAQTDNEGRSSNSGTTKRKFLCSLKISKYCTIVGFFVLSGVMIVKRFNLKNVLKNN